MNIYNCNINTKYLDDMTDERREGLDEFLQVLRDYFPQESGLHSILHKITSEDLLSRGNF